MTARDANAKNLAEALDFTQEARPDRPAGLHPGDLARLPQPAARARVTQITRS